MGDRYRNGYAYNNLGYGPTAHLLTEHSGRDRDRDRDRDGNPNVEYFGAGESYRPGGHTGQGPYRPPNRQPTDSWSSDRRGPRDPRDARDTRDTRDTRDAKREDIDSYIPPTSSRARPRSRSPGSRRRSRTPPSARGRNDLFADRMRSPARRPSPRRDDRARSPLRRRSRSPIGRRSPDPKRERDYSTDRRSPRRDRSPDRSYNRARSPRRGYSPSRDSRRGGYRSRSRTPPRKSAPGDDNWRRRSPSPRPDSSAPSRRSSPLVHPDRLASVPRSPAYNSRYESRREASPDRYDTEMTDDYHQNGSAAPPTGPSRNGTYDRAPPSGPSRGYSQSSQAPPTGPSMSAHNRGGPGMGAAPTRPRGGFGGPPRDFASPPMRGRGSLTYRAPSAPRSTSYSDAPPSGPRAGGFGRGDFGGGRGDYGGGFRGGFGRGAEGAFPFRGSNNSTSTTYPRTQRFNTVQQHLNTTEKIVPGGKALPSGLTPEQERKLKQLEAESEKIRVELAEKQKVKREAVNEWESRERESEREALRSELAEQSLQTLMEGEDTGMAAF